MSHPFIHITSLQSLAARAQSINERGGYLLIGEMGFPSEITFRLFKNPTIHDGQVLASPTSREKADREYLLRARQRDPADRHDGAYLALFKKREIGSWTLDIWPSSVVSQGGFLPSHCSSQSASVSKSGQTLYIPTQDPQDPGLIAAFASQFVWAQEQFMHYNRNPALSFPAEAAWRSEFLPYILEDLRTGSVMEHNARAGLEADALFGMA